MVSEVAQRWANTVHCKVIIKTSLEQNLWADPKQQSDIVGWYFSPRGQPHGIDRRGRDGGHTFESSHSRPMQHAAVPGISRYLLFPRGNKVVAEELVAAADVLCTSIYQYNFFNGVTQIL